MSDIPATKYAVTDSGDHVAYQVIGDGPLDLVFAGRWYSNVDAVWDVPPLARFLRRLASFSRLIIFDKRGVGVSDPVPLNALPTLEEWMDDLRVVLDTIGSERAALWTQLSGSLLALLFAATHPSRTSALVIENGVGRWSFSPDYPQGLTPERAEAFITSMVKTWPTAQPYDVGMAGGGSSPALRDESLRDIVARYQRACASPATVRATLRMVIDSDVRHVFPAVRAPTMVIHNGTLTGASLDATRALSEEIGDAKFVALPATDLNPYEMDRTALVDEVEEFLTGSRPAPESDRVLATVLYTDFVDSTQAAARLGDRAWRDLLDRHDELARRELERLRGRWVKHTGDGILATFDGPARAIRCAEAVRQAARGLGIETRAGLHCGEIELRGDDVTGLAVTIGRRVSDLAGPGEVFVSSTVKDLVAGSGITFADRGTHQLKGVPDEWRLFAVES